MSGELSRRDLLRLGATAVGAAALSACVPGGAAESRRPASPVATAVNGADFRVGVILPTSGTYADLGDSIRKGLKLYLDRAGGQAGDRRIVVVDRDEPAGDPSGAVAAARGLVERDGATLLAGIVSSPNALAVRGYADERRVPTLIAHAGADALSRGQASPFVYRTSYSEWQLGQPFGRYLADSGVTRLALVYSNYSAGLEMASAIKEGYTGQVLTEVRPPFPNPDGDFAAHLTQVNNTRPQAAYVFLWGRDAVAFLKQARTELNPGIWLTGCGYLAEPDVLAALGDAAPVGALTGLHWALALDTAENRRFSADFSRAFGRTADVYAVQGYDTARVIVEALQAIGGRTDDRVAFMKAISEVRFKSPRGDFRFDPNSNNVVNTIYVRQVAGDPKAGYANRVVGSLANVVDPGR